MAGQKKKLSPFFFYYSLDGFVAWFDFIMGFCLDLMIIYDMDKFYAMRKGKGRKTFEHTLI